MRSTKTMATPKEKAAPSAETHPYMLVLKYEDNKYYRYPSGARNSVLARLNNQRKMWERLANVDGMMAVDELITQAGWIGDEGGVVDGVIDPYTGTRFRAEVIRRQTL